MQSFPRPQVAGPVEQQARSRSFIAIRSPNQALAKAPSWLLAGFTLIAVTLFTSRLLIASYRHGFFVGDDFISLAMSRHMSLGKYFLEPLNEHIVPLHRVVMYLTDAVQSLHFGFALLVLYGFHALGVVYLYRVLLLIEDLPDARAVDGERSAPRFSSGRWLLCAPSSWFLFAAYCSNVYLCGIYSWWTAGLHRLPYIAFSIMALFYFLRYREERRKRLLVACALCLPAALGFFTKGVLIPIYLLGIEVCLWTITARRDSLRNLRVIAGFGLATGAFLVLWHYVEPPAFQTVNKNVAFQLDYLQVSWLVLRDSTVGRIHADGPDLLALSFVLWVAAITHTVGRRRSTIVVWTSLALLLALNVFLTSASKHRTQSYGTLLALSSYRYYYELLFPIIVFAALAFRMARMGPAALSAGASPLPRGAQNVRWLPASCCMALSVAVMLNGYANCEKVLEKRGGQKAQVFVARAKKEVQRVRSRETGPIRFVDSWGPHEVGCTLGMFLAILKVDAKAVEPGPGVYEWLPDGRLVPATPAPKKSPSS